MNSTEIKLDLRTLPKDGTYCQFSKVDLTELFGRFCAQRNAFILDNDTSVPAYEVTFWKEATKKFQQLENYQTLCIAALAFGREDPMDTEGLMCQIKEEGVIVVDFLLSDPMVVLDLTEPCSEIPASIDLENNKDLLSKFPFLFIRPNFNIQSNNEIENMAAIYSLLNHWNFIC